MANCWRAAGAYWTGYFGGANNASQLIARKYLLHKRKQCQLSAAAVYLPGSFGRHRSMRSCWWRCLWSRACGLVDFLFTARGLPLAVLIRMVTVRRAHRVDIYFHVGVCICMHVCHADLISVKHNGKVKQRNQVIDMEKYSHVVKGCVPPLAEVWGHLFSYTKIYFFYLKIFHSPHIHSQTSVSTMLTS